MFRNSILISFILKLYNSFLNCVFESRTWQLLTVLNAKFNNAVRKSCIVNICSGSDNFDDMYKKWLQKFSAFFEKIFSNIFTPVNKAIINSTIFSRIFEFCNNILSIPLVYIGTITAIWGVFLLLHSFLLNDSKMILVLSAIIFAVGVLMIILRKSVATLLNESFFVKKIGALFGFNLPTQNINLKKFSFKMYVLCGVVLGLCTFVFGTITTLLAVCLFLIVVFGFYFTSLAAVIYICVLPFMPTMVMVAGGLALFLCVIIKQALSFNKNLFNDGYLMNMFLLFMGIAFFLSALFSFARGSSIKIALVYIAFLCVTFALIRLLSTKKILLAVLSCISLFSIPVSLFGMYQHFTGFDEQNTWIDKEMFDEISGRVVSFFGNPNVFGEYLILIILTALVCFFIIKNKPMKFVHLISVALAGVSLIFTYSRGCWIGVLFAVVIFLFMCKRKLFALFCVLGACSVFFLPDAIITRFMSVGNLADSSTSYRVYIWEGTLRMLKDYWLTGIGLGSDAFNSVYPLYAYSAISAPHPHNLYLLILTETGIVGAIAFSLIIVLYYKRLFSIVRYSGDVTLKTVSAALVAAMSGFLLQGMFDNVWYNYRIFLLFWIYIALGAIAYIVSRSVKNG